jgi:hypothetical protein
MQLDYEFFCLKRFQCYYSVQRWDVAMEYQIVVDDSEDVDEEVDEDEDEGDR